MFNTLIDAKTAQAQLSNPDWIWVDCRFQLANPNWGRAVYIATHIPGAAYVHLDDDLSGGPHTDSGRHPLPSPDALRRLFSKLGINSQKQVIAYDQGNGMIAARLWWMLRYMGHKAVAVLEGGWAAWHKAGYPTQSGIENPAPAAFEGEPQSGWLVQVDEISSDLLLIDSRSPERYRGELEPIDAKAGHIPQAINYFYQNNWVDEAKYHPAAELKMALEQILGDVPAEQAVFYCGSGVTACANLLALAHAGLGNGRLYVGSWSEWIQDPERPIATK